MQFVEQSTVGGSVTNSALAIPSAVRSGTIEMDPQDTDSGAPATTNANLNMNTCGDKQLNATEEDDFQGALSSRGFNLPQAPVERRKTYQVAKNPHEERRQSLKKLERQNSKKMVLE